MKRDNKTKSEVASRLRQEAELRRRLPDPMRRRAIRTLSGVPVAVIAETIGVTAATVRNWERGDCYPRGEHLVRYVAALDSLQHGALP
jgi:DNA-binding transcriptional regulator YiaG